MEILKLTGIKNPSFVTGIVLKTRPAMNVAFTNFTGTPEKYFDEKLFEVKEFLNSKNINAIEPTVGIFYLNRNEVGADKVN